MLLSNAITAALIAVATADYTTFFFSGNDTCPGLQIGCQAPDSLCAYDSVVDKHYCCSGASYDICRAYAASCGGSDNGPSSSQQQCTSDGSTWCCLKDREQCTQRTGKCFAVSIPRKLC